MNFFQFVLILRARYKIILLVFLITVLTTLLVSLMLPKTYKASSTLMLTHMGKDPVTGMVMPSQLMSGYIATQMDIIKSASTARKVIDLLKLDQIPVIQQQFDESEHEGSIQQWLANMILKNVDVEPSRESSIFSISYKGTDPQFVATMANAFAEAYQEINIRLSVEPSQKASVFFSDQIKLLRDNLEAAQKKLTQYQLDEGIVNVDHRLDIETSRLNELSSQLVRAQSEVMGSSLEEGNSSIVEGQSVVTNALVNNLKGNLAQAEARLADLSQRLGKNHPSYKSAKAEVDTIRLELNRHVRATSSNAFSRVDEIRAALEEQKMKVLALNRTRDELQLLVREVEGAQHAYDSAMQRLNQTNLEGQANLSSVSLLDPAVPPVTHDSPKLRLNMLLSVFLGTLLGVGFGLLMEMLDRRVRSSEDLAEVLQTPVLGEIKWIAPKQKRLRLSLFRPLLLR